MACGQDNSLSTEILAEHEVNRDFEPPLIEKLDYNPKKSTFTWSGSFEELQSFYFKYLNIDPAACSITMNEKAKTIKTSSLILNFYKTRTLQVQGSDCQKVNAQLQSIFNDTKANNVFNDESAATLLPMTKNLQFPARILNGAKVLFDTYHPAIKRSRHLILKEKLAKCGRRLQSSFEKPREADLNNAQLINTLQQRNQNLCNEISILKERLLEETTKLKRISEERDSYITALQVLTKELRVDGSVAISSNADQAEMILPKQLSVQE